VRLLRFLRREVTGSKLTVPDTPQTKVFPVLLENLAFKLSTASAHTTICSTGRAPVRIFLEATSQLAEGAAVYDFDRITFDLLRKILRDLGVVSIHVNRNDQAAVLSFGDADTINARETA